MIPEGIAGLFLAAGLAVAGLGISVICLARWAGGPAPVLPLRRLTLWDFLAAGLLLLILDGLMVQVLGSKGDILLVRLARLFLAGGGAWLFLGWRERSFLPRRQSVPHRKMLKCRAAVRCYLMGLPGLLGLWIFNAACIRYFGGEVPTQGLMVGLKGLSWLTLLGVAIFAVLGAPLLEEGLFRGYLWRWLAGRDEFGPRRALLLSSVIFALAHEWQVWLPVFYLGILLGWIYWRGGKLRYAVAVHGLHNALTLLLFFLPTHSFLAS